MKRTAALGVLSILLLAGCGTAGGDPGGGGTSDDEGATGDAGAVDLAGRSLVATGITEGGAAYELVDGTEVSLDFGDGEVTARAGCNTMTGTFQVEGQTLAYTAGATTEMGCEQELQEQDEWLTDFLQSQPEVTVDGDQVVLTSGDTEMTLMDRAVAHPPLPVEGTTWTVESIISGDAVSSAPSGATATLTLDGEGNIAVSPGCNTGGGDYELSGDTLSLGPIRSTMMACEGAKMDLENAVLTVLDAGDLTVVVEGDVLTLTAGDQGLQLRGEE
ncbi:META domain-containing protein [Ornithinicoccus hortensis]|uniref:Heat shock protein HslJ n=1 Tax=Ornithinicoccus hortensis TaxID=82346 RepID=A0A542YLR1_9MICO|nr:META domain-containing protein [Ornithinicoccus hortensis]TQL49036.1 heat shock protein HslJ [Ornithinicoccus hortensis]